jgi:hypothetical protein
MSEDFDSWCPFHYAPIRAARFKQYCVVIVNYLNIVSVIVAPHKADALLIVDPNIVLAVTVSLERFQPVAGRYE